MINCKTPIDENAQKALTKKFYIISLIALIVGAIGIVAYIVIGVFVESSYLDIMLVFSLPFGFGLVYVISINKIIKKAVANNIVNEYEFDNDFFNVSSYKNGEVVGTSKVYYKDLYKIKEKDGYIFLYINISNAYIVKEDALSENDQTLLKALLKINKNVNLK